MSSNPNKPNPNKPNPNKPNPNKPNPNKPNPNKPNPNKPNPNKPNQSVNSPILLISLILFITLIIPYVALFYSSDSVITLENITALLPFFINTSTPDFAKSNTNIFVELMGKLRLNKFYLFIAVLLLITIIQLYVIYGFILGGDISYSKQVYGIISACFFSTVFVTFILIEAFPYLVEIFENTIGYGVLCLINPLMGDSSNIQNNLQIYLDKNKTTTDNCDFLLTSMNIFNMNNVIYNWCRPADPTAVQTFNFSMKFSDADEEKTNSSDPKYIKNNHRLRRIYNMVLGKHMMGHFVWIYFASLVSTFSMIKALPNTYGRIPLTHM